MNKLSGRIFFGAMTLLAFFAEPTLCSDPGWQTVEIKGGSKAKAPNAVATKPVAKTNQKSFVYTPKTKTGFANDFLPKKMVKIPVPQPKAKEVISAEPEYPTNFFAPIFEPKKNRVSLSEINESIQDNLIVGTLLNKQLLFGPLVRDTYSENSKTQENNNYLSNQFKEMSVHKPITLNNLMDAVDKLFLSEKDTSLLDRNILKLQKAFRHIQPPYEGYRYSFDSGPQDYNQLGDHVCEYIIYKRLSEIQIRFDQQKIDITTQIRQWLSEALYDLSQVYTHVYDYRPRTLWDKGDKATDILRVQFPGYHMGNVISKDKDLVIEIRTIQYEKVMHQIIRLLQQSIRYNINYQNPCVRLMELMAFDLPQGRFLGDNPNHLKMIGNKQPQSLEDLFNENTMDIWKIWDLYELARKNKYMKAMEYKEETILLWFKDRLKLEDFDTAPYFDSLINHIYEMRPLLLKSKAELRDSFIQEKNAREAPFVSKPEDFPTLGTKSLKAKA